MSINFLNPLYYPLFSIFYDNFFLIMPKKLDNFLLFCTSVCTMELYWCYQRFFFPFSSSQTLSFFYCLPKEKIGDRKVYYATVLKKKDQDIHIVYSKYWKFFWLKIHYYSSKIKPYLFLQNPLFLSKIMAELVTLSFLEIWNNIPSKNRNNIMNFCNGNNNT